MDKNRLLNVKVREEERSKTMTSQPGQPGVQILSRIGLLALLVGTMADNIQWARVGGMLALPLSFGLQIFGPYL